MKRYKLTIQRFKQSGKYYDTTEFATDATFIDDVAEEIKAAKQSGELPDEFIYLITGEGHPDGFPKLILND